MSPAGLVLFHRRQLYHPLVYLFCILNRSGSRSNDAVAKLTKREAKFYNKLKNVRAVCSFFFLLYFNFKKCQKHESPCALCHPMPKVEGDITRQGFRETEGLIFLYSRPRRHVIYVM